MATIKQIKLGDVIHDINAVRLDIDTKGSTTQPVYFSEGKPVACTYELKKTVPSDAKFTDTTYTLNSFGITATAAELNKMDGVTATTAELNYVDGVTSNIQTQLNSKAAINHASTATTYGAGTSSNYGHVKLSDSTSSTSAASAGIAATPTAVKSAYDLATTAKSTADSKTVVQIVTWGAGD